MKNLLLAGVCLFGVLITSLPAFGESASDLVFPSKDEVKSAVEKMDIPLDKKLSLRTILQDLNFSASDVQEDAKLSEKEKMAQLVQLRKVALAKTAKILKPAQQKQMEAILLPKS